MTYGLETYQIGLYGAAPVLRHRRQEAISKERKESSMAYAFLSKTTVPKHFPPMSNAKLVLKVCLTVSGSGNMQDTVSKKFCFKGETRLVKSFRAESVFESKLTELLQNSPSLVQNFPELNEGQERNLTEPSARYHALRNRTWPVSNRCKVQNQYQKS